LKTPKQQQMKRKQEREALKEVFRKGRLWDQGLIGKPGLLSDNEVMRYWRTLWQH
jgi:hypothetical protein